eukprot:SM000063S20060  [mRNA]  locus=s63:523407:526932:- [translate_table: standard]
MATQAAYVPPSLRAGAPELAEGAAARRVRGLVNRLAEGNVESVAAAAAALLQEHSRAAVSRAVTAEILAAAVRGPRASPQFASVCAAFVVGLGTAARDAALGANFAAAVAATFEEQYAAADSLALRNLTLLLAYLHTFGLLSSQPMYSFLGRLCERFAELDVASSVQLLQACGMNMRHADPQAMKDYIGALQSKAAAASATASADGTANSAKEVGLSKRVRFMLDAILDIKNNRRRREEEEPPSHARLKRWLRKLGEAPVHLASVTWERLAEPGKRGQWWLPSAESLRGTATATTAAGVEDEALVKLAAAQRMNTDARRAVFFAVMSAEDAADAFERITRLKLAGKQDREVMRVIVECCLQEKLFNKYYALLAARLCAVDKNHKFTLQYAVWDQFKQLPDMELRRSTNLARLLSHLIGSGDLPLSVLKAVDFVDPKAMKARAVLHFRVLFEDLLLASRPDSVLAAIFSRVATAPALGALRSGLVLFLNHNIRSHAASLGGGERAKLLQRRCRVATKALAMTSV